MAYFAYFHSIVIYGIIFWGNATNSYKVFKLQKRVIRIMSRAEPRASCRGLFRRLEILHVPCQYILSLILFIVDNPNNFPTVSEVHGLHASKKQLFTPNTDLTSVQKGITYSNIKIYSSLPINILSLKNDRRRFKNELHRYLVGNLFYSVKELLEFTRDK
jgi:hypothetical protein